MTRRKMKKIQESLTLLHIFHGTRELLPPDWRTRLPADRSVILELGCGKGAYTLALAKMFPEKNIIGIDIKGARLWAAAKVALVETLPNALFLRMDVKQIDAYFTPQSIAEIWITFPDPFPKKKQAKHRLTSPEFLARYKKILCPGGVVHLKTDDATLFQYTQETLASVRARIICMTENLHTENMTDPVLMIQTAFETKHLAAGKKIRYIAWQFS